jgi:two-component sensor histidine kinase
LKNINELEAKYQNEKKQTQIEQQTTELSQRRRIQWGLLAGLVVLGGLSFLLFRQNKRANRDKNKIKRQATQLETMMRELHHRTKNNMQVVSSLLSLQTSRLEDHSEAADALRSGQARVEAMSLIHQRLYQNADVATVDIQAFTKDLVEKLAFAFGQDPSVLMSKITIQKPILHVDTAMPLGLILNELLTNSFKYAFAKNDNPLLTIDLQEQNGQLRLLYTDNGTGLPPQYRIENSDSFGMQLIVSLAQQVDATYKYWNDAGFHFELSIPAT